MPALSDPHVARRPKENRRNEMLSKCRHRDKLLLNHWRFLYTLSLLHQIISPLIPLTLYQNHIKMLCVSLCINHRYTNISTYIYIVYLWYQQSLKIEKQFVRLFILLINYVGNRFRVPLKEYIYIYIYTTLHDF